MWFIKGIPDTSRFGYEMKYTIEIKNASLDFELYTIERFSLRSKLFGNRKLEVTHDKKNIENNHIHALRDLSLSFKDGDRVCILGHNGSGKSTLLRLIAKVYPPTTGEVFVKGTVTSLIDPSLGIDPESTGYENIVTKGLMHGKSKSEINERFAWIEEFSELGSYLSIPVRMYSSGMLMRLAYSISTAFEPEILVMDEWLSVGDENFRLKAANHLNSFIAAAGILVLATNDHELARRVGNRFVLLEAGSIVCDVREFDQIHH